MKALCFLVPLVVAILPLVALCAPFQYAKSPLGFVLATLLAGSGYVLAYIGLAGAFSRLGLSAVKAGRFPRQLSHPLYVRRRLYGICWTAIYYHRLLYWLVLSCPPLMWVTFRLFGYRGSLDIALYPDSWIRDLPLLHLEDGAYVANKCTLGTNMPLVDGSIQVGPVTVKKGACVGHLALMGHDSVLGEGAELGVGAVLGMYCNIGPGCRIAPGAIVGHITTMGSRCRVGVRAVIEGKATFGDDISIPANILIPFGKTFLNQSDVEEYVREGARA